MKNVVQCNKKFIRMRNFTKTLFHSIIIYVEIIKCNISNYQNRKTADIKSCNCEIFCVCV